jgi:hypothetical protein
MFGLMALALVAAAIFGGFYYWARRQGLVGTEEGQPKGRISLLTEVVAYIGVILLLSGGVAAVGQQWNHFSAWGHVAAFAGAAAFLFLVGFMLRGVREPAIRRLVSVLWFLSVACVAGAAGYLVHGVILSPAGPDGGATALSVGLAASLYAVALWLARRSAPQDLALFAGLIILICGIVAVAASGHTDAALLADALALWGFGLAWGWLGWRRYIEPMWLTVPLGALLALVAPSLALHPYGWMYAIGILTAAAAMAISVPLRNTVFLGMGAVAMFGYVTGVVMTYFRGSLGAPAALSITGALVIGVAAVTARLMRATRRAKPGEPAAEEPGQAPGPTAESPSRHDLPKAS